MKLGKKFLILLIIFTLTAGTLVGTALATPRECTCDEDDCFDPCGEPGDDCCACAAFTSECENCTSGQNCRSTYSMEKTYDEDCDKWLPKYAGTECSDC